MQIKLHQQAPVIVKNDIMPRPHCKNPDLSLLRMKEFGNCGKPLLRGFIYVRKYITATKCSSIGFKWPKNKGKVGDGEYTYIELAFNLRAHT